MRRHRSVKLSAVFACLLALVGPLRAEVIRVFGDEAYRPIIYLENGKPAGILPALFDLIAAQTGDTYELELMPWRRALSDSANGRGGITNISWNQERDKVYDFSQPIYSDDIQLVVLRGKEFPFDRMADLKGKAVGAAFDVSYGDDVDNAIRAGDIAIDRDPHQLSRMKKLLAGRIDVALVGAGQAGLAQLIAADPVLVANADRFVALPKPLVRDPLHLAFAKSMRMKPALERFNKALKALKTTTKFRQIVGQAKPG